MVAIDKAYVDHLARHQPYSRYHVFHLFPLVKASNVCGFLEDHLDRDELPDRIRHSYFSCPPSRPKVSNICLYTQALTAQFPPQLIRWILLNQAFLPTRLMLGSELSQDEKMKGPPILSRSLSLSRAIFSLK